MRLTFSQRSQLIPFSPFRSNIIHINDLRYPIQLCFIIDVMIIFNHTGVDSRPAQHGLGHHACIIALHLVRSSLLHKPAERAEQDLGPRTGVRGKALDLPVSKSQSLSVSKSNPDTHP